MWQLRSKSQSDLKRVRQFVQLNLWSWIVPVLAIVVVGIGLRVIQGPDHIIWDYDQARDSYAAKKVYLEKDVILVGQQAEIYGMFHGPLSYYYKGVFYALTDGRPWLVLLAMVVVNLFTVVPLGLLAYQLFRSRWLTLLTLLLFMVSYDQIGYARWLSNVSMSIPFMAWTFFFLFMVAFRKKTWQWSATLGVSLGLAIQGQLFLLYLIPWVAFWFYLKKLSLKHWLAFGIGLFALLLPQIVFEIKYDFQGVKIFYEWILLQKNREFVTAAAGVNGYLTHLGLTAFHSVFGFSSGLGIYGLIVALGMVGWQFVKKTGAKLELSSYVYIMFMLVSHSVVFVFHYVDAVFQDLGLALAMILLMVGVIQILWKYQLKLAVYCVIGFICFSQLALLAKNTKENTPFSLYKFAQTGILLSQKLEITQAIYELSEGKPFTFGVFGNPYGVRTTWASVFIEYLHRHPGAYKPSWYGYVANGYHGDEYFSVTDHPEQIHILLIEPNMELHSPYIRDQYFAVVDEATEIVEERELYGYMIQLRKKKTID